ncbi:MULTISPECIES: hypothetical protein [Kitasatospora]|uniref:DUF1851 domain-containing protein n=1 Tax=Kitasatospora cathayae TaxID=3004092 RepID=A0ABY7Q1U4_9ACTN|nr:hypothetical protein [Kitasatospora sp. HUAS 3-15]WBP86622.1 hypothetical protein O1G21_12730 [Kitasatospora sp. HUAS 3-15]
MSFTALWVLLPLTAADVERFAPLVHPVLAEHAGQPGIRDLRRRWEAGELGVADWNAFMELTGACPLDDHLDVFMDVCDAYDQGDPYLAASARKGYPIAGLAHGLGPERFAGLPGWFGDFLLTPAEAKAALPAVEAVFDLDDAERERVLRRAPEALTEGFGAHEPEALLDGMVPFWCSVVRAGKGLFAAQVTP